MHLVLFYFNKYMRKKSLIYIKITQMFMHNTITKPRIISYTFLIFNWQEFYTEFSQIIICNYSMICASHRQHIIILPSQPRYVLDFVYDRLVTHIDNMKKNFE